MLRGKGKQEPAAEFPRIKKGKGVEGPEWTAGDYVHFNFGYLLESTYSDCKEVSFFINLLGRMAEISRHSYDECRKAGHHTVIGTEVLPIQQFRLDVQNICQQIDKSAKKLTVYRAAGDNRAMVGLVLSGVFFVFGVETKINTLYRHGRRK